MSAGATMSDLNPEPKPDRGPEPVSGPNRDGYRTNDASRNIQDGGPVPTGVELEYRIRQLGTKLRTLHYRIVTTSAAYDNTGVWARTRHSTCAGWIAEELEVAFGTAREWLRVGHALTRLPNIDRSFAAGRLSYSQVRTLTRIAVEHPERDEELCDLAENTTARDLAVRLAHWCNENEDPEDTDKRHQKSTGLSCRTEPDGMGTINIRLPPLDHARAMAAIDAKVMTTKSAKSAPTGAHSALSVNSRASLAQQRARAFLHLITNEGASVNTEIIIHVRGDGTRLDDGTPVAAHYISQLLPQSAIRTMIHNAERYPIDVSGKHRYPTRRQQLVVNERQPSCECGSTKFLQYHHEPPYEEAQSTTLDGLGRLCGKCHRIRHSNDQRVYPPDNRSDEPSNDRPDDQPDDA